MFFFVVLRLKGIITTKLLAVFLGRAGLGVYSLFTVTGAVLWPIADLNIHYATPVFLPHCKNRAEAARLYYSHLLFAACSTFVTLGVAALIFQVTGLFGTGAMAVIALLVVASLADQFGRVFLQAFQLVHELARYDFTAQWLSFAGIVLGLVVFQRPAAAAAGLGLGLGTAALALHTRIFRETRPAGIEFDAAFRRRLLFGLSALPIGFFQWVMQSADYFLIRRFVGVQALGEYALPYNLCFAMTGVFYMLHSFVYPSLVRARKESRAAFQREHARFELIFLLLGGIALLAGSAIGPPLVPLLATRGFAVSARLFPLVLTAFVFMFLSIPPLNVLNLEKRVRPTVAAHAVGVVLNLGLNLLWVPRWGVFGAAWATVLSYMAVYGLLIAAGRRHVHRPALLPLFAGGYLLAAAAYAVLVSVDRPGLALIAGATAVLLLARFEHRNRTLTRLAVLAVDALRAGPPEEDPTHGTP